jgi:CheY-like chemotaxis protein/phosphoribosyl 1,2-cyclic phosphodiesterase
LRVHFWGTRGSIATPGPGTNHFGGNTSCVELETAAGQSLIFDCGTGARPLGLKLASSPTKTGHYSILIGHTHWDHIQGFPFFTPVFIPGNQIDVYAPEGGQKSLQDVLGGQMEFTYFPIELDQLPATINYHKLGEGTYQIAGVKVTTQFLNHPATTLGFRVESEQGSVVYLTDHEPFFERLWQSDQEPGRIESMLHEGDRRHARFMANADLVIHDAQYTPEEYGTKKNWGHSTFDYVTEVAVAAGVRKLALTHHDPTHDDDFVFDIERRARETAARRGSSIEIFCAYEGCSLDIETGEGSQPEIEQLTSAQPPVAQNLLLVDDNEELRKLTKRFLEREGFTIQEASNGRDALDRLAESIPNLLVLDLDMPQMGGLEVLRFVRAQPKIMNVPVLILTGSEEEASISACFAAGATDFILKPFSTPQLIARVRACLARVAAPHNAPGN